MTRRRASLSLAVAVLALAGADWRQFRGNDSTGVAPGAGLPAEFGPEKNVAWKTELPGRGLSGPIVVGGRVFLTASGGPRDARLRVLAFDAATGRRLWQRSFFASGPTDAHPKTCMAAPTPASDGKTVVALFGTNDLVALDLDGNVQWVRSLYEENPGATDGRGLASSPVVVGGTVVVHVETQNTSFAAGIDLRTGKDRWRLDRPQELCWTSPLVLPGARPAEDLVLLQGSTRLSAVDPLTGSEVWKLERDSDPIASGVVSGNVLYVPGQKGLAALALQPDRAPPKPLWEKPRLVAVTASPLVLGGRVYCLKEAILVAAEAATGDPAGELRLKGPFSASPVAAGGLLYCVGEDGLVQVVKPGAKEPTRGFSAAFGEAVLATPAIADGALYLRSDKCLWKIAGK